MKDDNLKHIPDHLLSTYQMIACVFPDGIDVDAYFPLLSILYNEMSDRNLAELISLFTGKDYAVVLNDVYRVTTTDAPDLESVTKLKQRLIPCGYQTWLDEDQ